MDDYRPKFKAFRDSWFIRALPGILFIIVLAAIAIGFFWSPNP